MIDEQKKRINAATFLEFTAQADIQLFK